MRYQSAYSRGMDSRETSGSSEGDRLLTDHDGIEAATLLYDPSEHGERPQLSFENALLTVGFGRFHYYMVAVLGWASSADAVEMLTVSFLLPAAECEFRPNSLEKGFLTAVGFAGMLLGAYIWGALADVYGRRKILFVCQTVNAVFALGTGLAQYFPFLIVMRLLSGFGVGGTAPIIFVYFVEFLPASKRGSMLGLLSTMWILGQIITAGMAWWILPQRWEYTSGAFIFNSWRLFAIIAAIPVVTSVLLFIPIPESPRYLLQKNRRPEAIEVLRTIYKKNHTDGTKCPAFTLEAMEDDGKDRGQGAIMMILSKTARLFTNPTIRWNFVLSTSILMCLSFGYYGLSMWFPELLVRLEHTEGSICSELNISDTNGLACNGSFHVDDDMSVYFDSFLMAISSIPGCVLYILFVEKVGRKVITSGTMLMSGITIFFVYTVTNRTGIVALMCVFTGITNVTWNSIGLITVEIFPTDVRSTAKGMQSLMQRVAAIIANVSLGALVDHHCSIPILAIATLLCVGGLLTVKLPNLANKDIK